MKTAINKCVIDFSTKIKWNGTILDIGCGTGYPIAKYLCEQGFHVVGIDASENMFKKTIKLNLSNAEFHCRDFFNYQPLEKYDGIIAFDSLFHFPKKNSLLYHRLSNWMNIEHIYYLQIGKEMRK